MPPAPRGVAPPPGSRGDACGCWRGESRLRMLFIVDDEEVATALQLIEYGGEDEHAWLLLEPEA